jgi:predicted O-methyltransferase YrrM
VQGRLHVVEIGVAEGASAVALRDGMDSAGSLYLIDPYHLSRVRPLNFLRRTAHRTLSGKVGPNVYWIEQFSQQAAKEWKTPIDFLMIDGDHAEDAVQRDWEDWHPHVISGGVVVFHDDRLFPSGWTSLGYGPVKFINRVFRQSPLAGWKIIDEVDSLVFVHKDKHLPQNDAAEAGS